MNLFTKQKQSQTQKTNQKGLGEKIGLDGEKLEAWDKHIHTTIYKIDNQQGPTVQHRELYPVSCNNL